MKKAFLFLGLAAAALTLTNCNKQESDFAGADAIEARINLLMDDTKTVNDGLNTNWKSGDAIAVWVAAAETPALVYSSTYEFTVDPESGTASGTIDELPGNSNNWYALYPYDNHYVNPTATKEDQSRSGYITIGAKANAAQTQNGNDSKAHLAGKTLPLYGIARAVTGTPSVTMKQICGVIAFNVINATNEPITVQSIKMTASESIIGTFYLDFSSGEPDLTDSGETFVANWAELTVNGGTPIAAGASAKFYMAVKPFNGNIADISVEADKGLVYKEAVTAPVSIDLAPGHIKTVNFTFDNAEEIPAKEYPYEESFATSQGDFTIDNVVMPEGVNYVWAWNSSKYMKASAYVSGTNYATESWLLSPVVDLSSAKQPMVYFSQCISKYFGDVTTEATLWIREAEGQWGQIVIDYPELNGNWSKMTDYSYSIAEYAGKKVQVGFKYVSTSNNAGTWEVKNFKLAEYEETPAVTLASISVSGQTTSFNVGDNFTFGGTVTATYSDQSTQDVTSSATFSGYDLTKAGNYTVTVSYTEGNVTKTTTYSITVVSNDDPNVNTVSVTISEYVQANGCTIASGTGTQTCYTDLDLNSSVRMSTTGSPNCGAFYNSGAEWRLYQSQGGNIIILVGNGCSLKSVKFTYNVNNGGVLKDATGADVKSNDVYETTGTSVEFQVGNTGEATNGQVRVTAVEVKYTGNGSLPPVDTPDPGEITTNISLTSSASVYVGETVQLNASSNVQGAAIVFSSDDESIATVDENGLVSGVAVGTVKIYARITGVAGSYTDAERYCNVTVNEKPQDVGGSWEATALSSIADGAQFVLVGTNANGSFAMSNNGGTSSAPAAVAVTISGSTLSNPASNVVFTMQVTSGGYVFTTDDGEKWVYTTASNNGIRVGTGTNNVFNLEASSGYLTISDGSNTRYLGIYNSQDWRSYTSINSNIKDQTFTFFVKK